MSVFLLLTLYTVVYTPVHELFKLPVLITHYDEHRNEDAGLSLTAFLRLHYLNENQNQTDNDRDMQLPFKKGECTLASFAAIFIPDNGKAVPEVPVVFIDNSTPWFKERNIASQYLASIWQPPRHS